MAIDGNKLQELINKMFGDVGAAMGSALVMLGDKFGFYKTLAADGPMTSAELASKTGTDERYVREWPAAQAAAGYINYDGDSAASPFRPSRSRLADENGPAFFPAITKLSPRSTATNRKSPKRSKGGGVGWHEHDASLFSGTERFFRPSYAMHLVSDWIPALEGVKRNSSGARGRRCRLWPRRFDNPDGQGVPEIEIFRLRLSSAVDRPRPRKRRASGSRLTRNLRARPGQGIPGTFDLVAFFDCLHDMGDPVGAAAHVRSSRPDGTWMVVEPFGDTGRGKPQSSRPGILFRSTMICTPASLSQEVGLGLGTQAGEKRLREVLKAGGFTRVRRATATPFNLVLEARPVTVSAGISVRYEAAVLDQLHRHALDFFRRGGLRLRRHLRHVNFDRGLSRVDRSSRWRSRRRPEFS